MEESTVSSGIPVATWPEAVPSKYEERILSVVCGNSSFRWAFHEGANHGFVPVLNWKTNPLLAQECQENSPCELLSQHMPTRALEVIFGRRSAYQVHRASALAQAERRRAAVLSIYIVSTNVKREQELLFLFRDIPTRMFKLSAMDFFTNDATIQAGIYPTMGVDRVAALKAAISFYGLPALVIDGGTATTYTAVQADGTLMGGGIGPGLQSKLQALRDAQDYDDQELKDSESVNDGSLSFIVPTRQIHKELYQISEKMAEPGHESNTTFFHKDRKDSILRSLLLEMKCLANGIVKNFIQHVGPAQPEAAAAAATTNSTNTAAANSNNTATTNDTDEEPPPRPPPERSGMVNTNRSICVTGGDGPTICNLLKPCEQEQQNAFHVVKFIDMIHYGIASALAEHLKRQLDNETKDEQMRMEVLGQRVAQRMDHRGLSVLECGFVSSVQRGGDTMENDTFFIVFDNEEARYWDIRQLYDGLVLFHEEGEGPPPVSSQPDNNNDEESKEQKEEEQPPTTIAMEEKAVDKVEDAGVCADQLVSICKLVKGHAKDKKAKEQLPVTLEVSRRSQKHAEEPPKKRPKVLLTGDPKSYTKRRVAKVFQLEDSNGIPRDEIYFGTVKKSYGAEHLWHIVYDDEDSEDYNEEELAAALHLYQREEERDPNRGRKKKRKTSTS